MISNVKCAVLEKINKPLKIHNIKFGKLKFGQVLVKIFYSGICGSQLMEVEGKRGKDIYLPHALGHEAVGKVIETGKGVKKIIKGDVVILSWIKSSGINSTPPKFFNKKMINAGRITTFSNYTIVSENRLIKKPKSIGMRESLLFGCALATGGGIVINEIMPKKTDKIAVIGLGGVGLSSLLTLKSLGFKKIYGVDNSPQKFFLIKKLGIKNVYNLKNKNSKNKFLRDISGGVDYCIEAAGLTKTIELGFSLLNNTGKLIFASHPKKNDKISLDPHQLIKGKNIKGSWGGNFNPDKDIKKLLKIFKKGKIDLKILTRNVYKLKHINKAIKDLKSGKVFRPIIEMSH